MSYRLRDGLAGFPEAIQNVFPLTQALCVSIVCEHFVELVTEYQTFANTIFVVQALEF